MLDEHKVPYRYRDYRREPLSVAELRRVCKLLGARPGELLRRHDRVARQFGLTGEEPARRLVELMAEHPTLLTRPIGVTGDRAVVGRPPTRLLELSQP